ncbi:hypothetical protein OIU84_018937, partial [Salix udensis]
MSVELNYMSVEDGKGWKWFIKIESITLFLFGSSSPGPGLDRVAIADLSRFSLCY